MVPNLESPETAPPSPESPGAPRPIGARIAFIVVVAGLVAVIGFVTWQGTLRARQSAGNGAVVHEPGVITLAVDGMSCVGCASSVETALEEVPGVAEAHVDYDERMARIRLSDEHVEASKLVAALEQAGYKARIEK